jgi:pectin methylesterase-like acyl-CoA thioesterase
VVGVDGNFSAAIAAATTAQSSGNRFRIFFPNGQYNIGGATTADANQMTTITLPNVSYIGQSSSGVSLYNLPTTEGIGVTATIHLTSTANNIYMQDLTLLNNYPYAQTTGRAVALWDQGTENIYKNVNVLSNQDTYYSGSGKCYFEGGSIHGTVDFICGGGDIFFNKCLLYLENRTGNNITAPATTSNWGYVFSNCTIDGYACTNGNYSLGRPWQNSPKSVYINTIMNVLPSASGWTTMGSVVQALFAEYNSTTPSGAPVDLSSRMTTYTYNGVSTPVNPILTANQAATYTIDNVLGGTDAWQPELYTDQATIPVISGNGTAISWADNNYVSCWVIFKDGVYVTTTTTNSYAIPTSTTTGTYTVCAANEMGGLSAVSNSYAYSYVATGINTPDSRSKIIEQRFYTVDGKKVLTLNGFKGIFIVCSIYADGHVETSKITKTDY